jgi:hypothetical protein
MRYHLFTLSLAVFAPVALASGSAAAQDPYAEYNRMRAYRHFLTSPSPVRTYSGQIPGSSYDYVTPYGSAHFLQPPGYLHQRISPRGFESYALVPPIRGYVVTPVPFASPALVYPPPPTLRWTTPVLPSAPGKALPAPVLDEDASTYSYDGGPRNPVPVPGSDEVLTVFSASLQREAPRRWTYPAYGEAPRRARRGEQQVLRTRARAEKRPAAVTPE